MAHSLLVLIFLLLVTAPVQSANLPALPNLPVLPGAYVDTTMPTTKVTKTVCAHGCNYTNSQLQAALNAANLGDVIELQAGATYPGKIVLPTKTSGTGWIIVRSSAWQSLPPVGTRVGPQHASLMAKITTNPVVPYDFAVVTQEGAHHYRFIGIEVTGADPPGQQHGLFIIDGSYYDAKNVFKIQPTNALTPHHIVIDRCYIHGNSTGEFIRGVLMNGLHVAIVDSYLSNFHSRSADTQAAIAWNTAGPLKLVNNYLEAAGENVMFGGAASVTAGYVPSDIEIRSNFFDKPLSWRPGDPAYAGVPWLVKNLIEFKAGQRVLIEGNVFGHHWAGGQSGFFFVLTPRGENNQNPWTFTGDITFRYNKILKTTAGPTEGGTDLQVTQKSNRILFEHNLFENLGAYVVPGAFNGEFTMIGNAIQNLTIRHNTIFQSSTPFHFAGDAIGPMNGLTVVDNIFKNGGYGIVGDLGGGIPELNAIAPGWVMRKNAIYGPSPNQNGITGGYYPPDNYIPASQTIVGFVNLTGGDYHLAASSYYKNAATDGKDPGADIDAVNGATACVMSGACGVPAPTTTVSAPAPIVPAPTPPVPAPTTTAPAPTTTVPAPTPPVPALKPPAPAPTTPLPAPTPPAPALKSLVPAPTTTASASTTTASAPTTTASASTTTASAPTATASASTTTASAPTATASAPMTTASAPTPTVPDPTTIVPAPMTIAPAPTTTTPAPPPISLASAPITSAALSSNSAEPKCSQKQRTRWWQIWRWFQRCGGIS
jgi:hypothetical protein